MCNGAAWARAQGFPWNLHAVAESLIESNVLFSEFDSYGGWVMEHHPEAFNMDFDVSFPPDDDGVSHGSYNFGTIDQVGDEMPGLSVFARDETGDIFHTYSCYSRGLDPFNAAYQLLDLTPKGRDEDDLDWSMAWLRRHDQY